MSSYSKFPPKILFLWPEHMFNKVRSPCTVLPQRFRPEQRIVSGIDQRASQETLVVKNPPANAGDTGDINSISGLRRSPTVNNGNHCSILDWRIPRTEKPSELQSTGPQKVGHNWTHTYIDQRRRVVSDGLEILLVLWTLANTSDADPWLNISISGHL